MKYNVNLGFQIGDYVYHIINNEKQKDVIFKVHKIEVEEHNSWHDGHEEKHYAYLENIETGLIERKQVAFFNIMCNIKDIYFIKCEDK